MAESLLSSIDPCRLKGLLVDLTLAEENAYRQSGWTKRSAHNESKIDKGSIGSQLLWQGQCIEDIHEYFSKFEYRKCCLTLAGAQNSLQVIRVVNRDDSHIDGFPQCVEASSDVEPFRSASLSQQEFRVFTRAFLCASCPLLTFTEPTEDVCGSSSPSFQEKYPAVALFCNRRKSSTHTTSQKLKVLNISNVLIRDDLCLISVDVLQEVLARAFNLSPDLAYECKIRVFELYRKKRDATILAEDLTYQLSLLETHKHPYYTRDKFLSVRAYERWCCNGRELVTELLNKFWHVSGLPRLPTKAQCYNAKLIHEDYMDLLQRLIKYDKCLNKATGDRAPPDLPLLSGPCERLLSEFALRYGIDVIYQKAAMLECLCADFDLDICHIKKVVATINDILHLLPPNRWDAIIVRQQVDQLMQVAELLLRHCHHLLARLDRLSTLPQFTSSAEGIGFADLIIELLLKCQQLQSYFSSEDGMPVAQILLQDVQENFDLMYQQQKTIACSDIFIVDSQQTSPQLVYHMLNFIRESVTRYSAWFQPVFAKYFDITHLASVHWYRMLMDDVAILCKQHTERTDDADFAMVGLMYRLNRLDTDWASYIPICEQTWRQHFSGIVQNWFSVIKLHSLQLLLQALSHDKFATLQLTVQRPSLARVTNLSLSGNILMSRSLTASTHSAFSRVNTPMCRVQPEEDMVLPPEVIDAAQCLEEPWQSKCTMSNVQNGTTPWSGTDTVEPWQTKCTMTNGQNGTTPWSGTDTVEPWQSKCTMSNGQNGATPCSETDTIERHSSHSNSINMPHNNVCDLPAVENVAAALDDDDKHELSSTDVNIQPITRLNDACDLAPSLLQVDHCERLGEFPQRQQLTSATIQLICATGESFPGELIAECDKNENEEEETPISNGYKNGIIAAKDLPFEGPTKEVNCVSIKNGPSSILDFQGTAQESFIDTNGAVSDVTIGCIPYNNDAVVHETSLLEKDIAGLTATCGDGLKVNGQIQPCVGDAVVCTVDGSSGKLFLQNRCESTHDPTFLKDENTTTYDQWKPLSLSSSSSLSALDQSFDTNALLMSDEVVPSASYPHGTTPILHPESSSVMRSISEFTAPPRCNQPAESDIEAAHLKHDGGSLMSLRLSSSLIDIVCIIQRLVNIGSIWMNILCTESKLCTCSSLQAKTTVDRTLCESYSSCTLPAMPCQRVAMSCEAVRAENKIGSKKCAHCLLREDKDAIRQHIYNTVESVTWAYSLNLLAMDICGLSSHCAEQLVGHQLVTDLVAARSKNPVVLWGCRHKTQGKSCLEVISNFEPTSREMCVRVNDVAQLADVISHCARKIDEQLSSVEIKHCTPLTAHEEDVVLALISIMAFRICQSIKDTLNKIFSDSGLVLSMPVSNHRRSVSSQFPDIHRPGSSTRLRSGVSMSTSSNIHPFQMSTSVDCLSDKCVNRLRELLVPVTAVLVQMMAMMQSWLSSCSYQKLLDLLARHIAQIFEKCTWDLFCTSATERIEFKTWLLKHAISIVMQAGKDITCSVDGDDFGNLLSRYLKVASFWLDLCKVPTASLLHYYSIVASTANLHRSGGTLTDSSGSGSTLSASGQNGDRCRYVVPLNSCTDRSSPADGVEGPSATDGKSLARAESHATSETGNVCQGASDWSATTAVNVQLDSAEDVFIGDSCNLEHCPGSIDDTLVRCDLCNRHIVSRERSDDTDCANVCSQCLHDRRVDSTLLLNILASRRHDDVDVKQFLLNVSDGKRQVAVRHKQILLCLDVLG